LKVYAPTSRSEINSHQALMVLEKMREGCAEVAVQIAGLSDQSKFEGFTITKRRKTPGRRKRD